MEVNCHNCGKCCFSDIPDSYYIEEKVLSYEESKKHPKRNNIVYLTPSEVEFFWRKSLGCALVVDSIMFNEKKNELCLFISINNFPKIIEDKWVLACPFLNSYKRCRLYGTDFFPSVCQGYPFSHINEGYPPLCEAGRLKGELNNDQRSVVFTTESSLTLPDDFSFPELKKAFATENNTLVICSILQDIYGSPDVLKGKEKVFVIKLMEKINKEIKFKKENFKPS